jgi:hypothetical protein
VIWWKWIGDRWATEIERQFYRDLRAWCREGVGYLYRRRKQPKIRKQLLPYDEPAWATACEPSKKKNGRRRTAKCKCVGCWPTVDSPKSYEVDHRERVIIASSIGWPVPGMQDDGRGQDDWDDWTKWKRSEPKEWKVRARIKLGSELLFWPDDNSDQYDWHSVEIYSRAVYAKKPRYPERIPWLLALHDLYNLKDGTLNAKGEDNKPVGRDWWSPFLLGEESNDYLPPLQVSQLFVHCPLGKVNKRQIERSQINAEITVRPPLYFVRRVDFDSKRRPCAPRPQRERWRFYLKDGALNVFGFPYDERNRNEKAA